MKKQVILGLLGLSLTACAGDYYYEYGGKVEVTKLSEQRNTHNQTVNYYKTESGHKVSF